MKHNPQAEIIKTSVAAVGALCVVAATWLVFWATQAGEPDRTARVGKAFFEAFESADQIAQMEIAALDDNGTPLSFVVKKSNGLWTIPSHYEYPAEAGERLSRTATVLIGLERRRLASSEKAAQERFGTLDPNSEEGKADPENAGKALRFLDTNGEEVFNLIVGREVERDPTANDSPLGIEAEEPAQFYVRVPSEKETYVANLDLDISTRFVDWINKDLLEFTSRDIRQLRVDNSVLETRQVLTNQGIALQRQRIPGEELILEKSDEFSPWTIGDLNSETEQLNNEIVNALVGTIDNIEFMGVRPRYKYQGQTVLGPDLSFVFPENVGDDIPTQQAIVDELQDDLLSRGFGLTRNPETNDIQLVSDHGEFSAVTREGLVYTLYFGAQIEGEEEAIQIGQGEAAEPSANSEDADDESADNQANEKPDQETDQNSKGRFLLVRVSHDPNRMADRPEPPVEPQPMTLPDNVGRPTETPETEASATDSGSADEQAAVQKGENNNAGDNAAEEAGTTEQKAEAGEAANGEAQSGAEGDKGDEGQTESIDEEATETGGGQINRLGPYAPEIDDETVANGPSITQDEKQEEAQGDVQGGETKENPPVDESQINETAQEEANAKSDVTADAGAQDTEGLATESQKQEMETAAETKPAQNAADAANQNSQEQGMTREDMQKALDAEYERQKAAFEQQKQQYEQDVKAFEERVQKAQEKAERLSQRFADWYYVVPSSNLDRLRLTRAEVVQPKAADDAGSDLPIQNPLGLPPGFQLPPSGLPGN